MLQNEQHILSFTGKCEFKEKECIKQNAICELDENYEAVCRCPPMLTKEGTDGPCNKIGTIVFFNTRNMKLILSLKYLCIFYALRNLRFCKII